MRCGTRPESGVWEGSSCIACIQRANVIGNTARHTLDVTLWPARHDPAGLAIRAQAYRTQ
ncbi:protein of unknown function [Desulfovibrio sp. 86]|nr:protein of unknown function [Desulfovibrio sp. 86]